MGLFNHKDPLSIIRFAEKLKGISLRSALRAQGREADLLNAAKACGKGSLGNLVQHAYFGIPANSLSEADFNLAGLELKVTPLKRTAKKGLRSKERIVLNLIRYTALAKETTLEKSSFLKKNRRLLILFYIYEKDKDIADLQFFAVLDWTIPTKDLPAIRRDWDTIAAAAKNNMAHELSEGDTLYLGACTKGAGAGSWQEQDGGPTAKQRAFSLKSAYVNRMLEGLIPKDQKSILEGVTLPVKMTFEEWVVDQYQPFLGKSLETLAVRFRTGTKAKHAFNLAATAIAKNILGVGPSEKIAEFERADIQIKTIRLTHKGVLKESMSFRQIRFEDIVNQEWEDSMFYEDLSQRFFFVIFQDDAQGTTRLKKVRFWSVPPKDMYEIKEVWEDTKTKVAKGRYDDLFGASDHDISHVRPKGRNAADKMRTPQGGMQSKKCFWLNRGYILKQIAG